MAGSSARSCDPPSGRERPGDPTLTCAAWCGRIRTNWSSGPDPDPGRQPLLRPGWSWTGAAPSDIDFILGLAHHHDPAQARSRRLEACATRRAFEPSARRQAPPLQGVRRRRRQLERVRAHHRPRRGRRSGRRHPLHRHQPRQAERPRRSTRMLLPPAAGREPHQVLEQAHLAADRTSCTKATANQFRLFLHAGAYWLMSGCAPRRRSARALPARNLTRC